MPNIIRDFHKDTFYHVYNRGFNKQLLFLSENDYDRFVRKIAEYQQRFPSIKVSAYCLLPNHFHFLLQDKSTKDELAKKDSRSTSISEFMKGLQLSHAMYFTNKYGKIVKKNLKLPVYEGRFCSKGVLNDDYLESVKNYIDESAGNIAYESSTQYQPRFDFYGIAQRSVRTNMGKEMDKAIGRGLRSAKRG